MRAPGFSDGGSQAENREVVLKVSIRSNYTCRSLDLYFYNPSQNGKNDPLMVVNPRGFSLGSQSIDEGGREVQIKSRDLSESLLTVIRSTAPTFIPSKVLRSGLFYWYSLSPKHKIEGSFFGETELPPTKDLLGDLK